VLILDLVQRILAATSDACPPGLSSSILRLMGVGTLRGHPLEDKTLVRSGGALDSARKQHERDSERAQHAAASSHTATASVPLLPPPWNIARDPATCKFYFYNTTTGVVQWEPPASWTSAVAAMTGQQLCNAEKNRQAEKEPKERDISEAGREPPDLKERKSGIRKVRTGQQLRTGQQTKQGKQDSELAPPPLSVASPPLSAEEEVSTKVSAAFFNLLRSPCALLQAIHTSLIFNSVLQ
jgi:hypothetical protein